MIKKCIIPLIVIGILVSGCGSKSPYTKEQAMVKRGYEAIRDTLLDPESMIVYDAYAWTSKSDELSMAQAQNKANGTETEMPDDEFVTYYHIGARNRMGGMTDAEYIVICDPVTGEYKGSGEKNEVQEAVDAYIDGDKTVDLDRDVQGQFLNVEFWNAMGWPESTTDYKDFIESEDYKKVDVEKILED